MPGSAQVRSGRSGFGADGLSGVVVAGQFPPGADRGRLLLPGQWIKDLAAEHQKFADTLAERQSLRVPSEDPGYGDLGQAFPSWPGPGRDAILQPPKPDIRPSRQVLERAADRDAGWEAAD